MRYLVEFTHNHQTYRNCLNAWTVPSLLSNMAHRLDGPFEVHEIVNLSTGQKEPLGQEPTCLASALN